MLQPVVTLMLRTQAVNLPPWKIVTWFVRLKEIMKLIESHLKAVEEGAKPSNETLHKLSKHWEELTSSEDDEDEEYCGTFQVILPYMQQTISFLQIVRFYHYTITLVLVVLVVTITKITNIIDESTE